MKKKDPARVGLDQWLWTMSQQHWNYYGLLPLREAASQDGDRLRPSRSLTSCKFSLLSASSTHFCSRGRSLHMFFRLSCRASKRQMVVWLNTFPGEVG